MMDSDEITIQMPNGTMKPKDVILHFPVLKAKPEFCNKKPAVLSRALTDADNGSLKHVVKFHHKLVTTLSKDPY